MHTDVFIAGAGLAGLSLARALHDKRGSFLLAEARNRVGGRILSIESAGDNQETTVADMGPSWIWPGQTRIATLLDQLGIKVFEQYSSGRLVYEDERGQVRRDLDYSTMAGSLRVRDGLARLTRELATRLPAENLWLSHRVVCIRQQAQGYQIDLEHAAGRLQLHANQVVLAMPPRLVAERIDFDPPLPQPVMRDLRATPTWMAGHAKLFVHYQRPFWRDMGLSGDGISRLGPLMEIHDASPAEPGPGALFGFVGLPVGSPARESSRLVEDALKQLERMFGPPGANPLDVIVKDWAEDIDTATPADNANGHHPQYGVSPAIAALAQRGLLFASTEMASQFGGFVEGALEASQATLQQLESG
ncbi:MAG: FAD-dependent oxidoreductase [Gammaproteobacteria bacterium]|jgi:monoamine oxidase|nr:FAD-dependent oxidoreductase [Gammaproteobacteria bacterium]